MGAVARRRAAGIAAFLRPRRPAGPSQAAAYPVESDLPSASPLPGGPATGDAHDDPDATATIGDLQAALARLDAPAPANPDGPPATGAPPGPDEASPEHPNATNTAAIAGDGGCTDATGPGGAGAGPRTADAARRGDDTSQLLVPIEHVPEQQGNRTRAWLETLHSGDFVHTSAGRAAIALVAAIIVMILGGLALVRVGPGDGNPSAANAGFPVVTNLDGTPTAPPTIATSPTAPPNASGAPTAPRVEASMSSAPSRRPAPAAAAPRPATAPPPAQPAPPAPPPSTQPACYSQWPPILATWLDQMGRC